jgi:hypothetical protein
LSGFKPVSRSKGNDHHSPKQMARVQQNLKLPRRIDLEAMRAGFGSSQWRAHEQGIDQFAQQIGRAELE